MATIQKLNIRQVKNDSDSISSVARTINLAFSPDPLIQWLRPGAIPWSHQTPEICRWQYRRVQRVMLDGLAFQSLPVNQMAQAFPAKPIVSKPCFEATSYQISEGTGSNSGAVVFLFPPKQQCKWTLRRLLLSCKLWILDRISPVIDTSSPEMRGGKLLNAHEKSVALIKSKYRLQNLWYLEVVAVHPSLQSRGLGVKTLRWVLDYVGENPIFLECTRRDNIGFYEGLGFEVAEEVDLVDETDDGLTSRVQYWVMVHK